MSKSQRPPVPALTTTVMAKGKKIWSFTGHRVSYSDPKGHKSWQWSLWTIGHHIEYLASQGYRKAK